MKSTAAPLPSPSGNPRFHCLFGYLLFSFLSPLSLSLSLSLCVRVLEISLSLSPSFLCPVGGGGGDVLPTLILCFSLSVGWNHPQKRACSSC